MGNTFLDPLKRLTDGELLAQAQGLAGRGREVTAQLVAHLVEIDARRLHEAEASGSLFGYCVDVLRLSESEACLRIQAAHLARRFPLVLDMICDGSTNVSCLKVLSPHLTPENHEAVLSEASGKRKSEVEIIAARLAPRADVPTSLRRLPAPSTPVPSVHAAPAPPAAPPLLPTPPARAAVAPLSPARYSYHLTIDEEAREMLQLARDMASHALRGDDLALLKRALHALLEKQAREKFAATDKPGAARETGPDSRHVPAAVKRGVFFRDLGHCAFVAADGRRCQERAFLEFHHVKPWMAGGETTTTNVQLRCRRHNGYEARRFFDKPELAPEQAVNA
jgi:hypothetical protein